MPARSEAQQRLMGMALAAKRGKGHFSGKVKEVANSMTEKQLRDFAKTKHEGLPEKKAYIEGFMKRAAEYGYSRNEIGEALKMAEAYGNFTLDKYSPGGIPVLAQEHEPGILNHLNRNAGKYIGGATGLTLATLLDRDTEGYVPGTFTSAILPFTLGSAIDDVRERKNVEEKLQEPETLEGLRRLLAEKEQALQYKTAGVIDKIKQYLKKEHKEDEKSILEKENLDKD
jgi:hypothetical protein